MALKLDSLALLGRESLVYYASVRDRTIIHQRVLSVKLFLDDYPGDIALNRELLDLPPRLDVAAAV